MFSKRLDQSSFPRTMEEGPFLGGESVGGVLYVMGWMCLRCLSGSRSWSRKNNFRLYYFLLIWQHSRDYSFNGQIDSLFFFLKYIYFLASSWDRQLQNILYLSPRHSMIKYPYFHLWTFPSTSLWSFSKILRLSFFVQYKWQLLILYVLGRDYPATTISNAMLLASSLCNRSWSVSPTR